MVRSMMRFAGLPIFLWGYALESTCYILNRVLSKSINKTPYEIWIGCKPVLSKFMSDLRVFESIILTINTDFTDVSIIFP